MKRLHDWQLRLREFAREKQATPFEWGKNDCCLFAADAVLAITGEDVAADMRGSYDSALGAARQLEAMGGVGVIATARLGPSVSPRLARIGDVVLLSIDGAESLGLCNGTSVLGPSEAGTRAYGMDVAVAAWRVG